MLYIEGLYSTIIGARKIQIDMQCSNRGGAIGSSLQFPSTANAIKYHPRSCHAAARVQISLTFPPKFYQILSSCTPDERRSALHPFTRSRKASCPFHVIVLKIVSQCSTHTPLGENKNEIQVLLIFESL